MKFYMPNTSMGLLEAVIEKSASLLSFVLNKTITSFNDFFNVVVGVIWQLLPRTPADIVYYARILLPLRSDYLPYFNFCCIGSSHGGNKLDEFSRETLPMIVDERMKNRSFSCGCPSRSKRGLNRRT